MEIDVDQDLEQVNKQLNDLVTQANQLQTQKDNLTQQIHNLNGVAMYLRGKQQGYSAAESNGTSEGMQEVLTS